MMTLYTGLFFGSFNPLHNGHLLMARYLLDHGYCRKIWFIVSPQNPWKEDRTLLDEQKRLEIVKAAIAAERQMEACDIEFYMPRPSYTYETLQLLSERYPDERFALIIGGDNLKDFHLWKNHLYIRAHYPLLVYPRPGILFSENHDPHVTVVDAPMTAVSSTEIREKIARGEDISSEVPAEVLELIWKYYGEK